MSENGKCFERFLSENGKCFERFLSKNGKCLIFFCARWDKICPPGTGQGSKLLIIRTDLKRSVPGGTKSVHLARSSLLCSGYRGISFPCHADRSGDICFLVMPRSWDILVSLSAVFRCGRDRFLQAPADDKACRL